MKQNVLNGLSQCQCIAPISHAYKAEWGTQDVNHQGLRVVKPHLGEPETGTEFLDHHSWDCRVPAKLTLEIAVFLPSSREASKPQVSTMKQNMINDHSQRQCIAPISHAYKA